MYCILTGAAYVKTLLNISGKSFGGNKPSVMYKYQGKGNNAKVNVKDSLITFFKFKKC